MNKFLLSAAALFIGLPAMAQLNGSGYYRLKNFSTKRYIVVTDNRSKGLNVATTTYDLHALCTLQGFDTVEDDPASIFYITKVSGYDHNLTTQGADVHEFSGLYVKIRQATNSTPPTYYAWGEKAGQSTYLADLDDDGIDPEGIIVTSGTGATRNWYITPVDASSDNYFGVKPEFTVGGQGYTSLFAEFPFSFATDGMKAFVVTKIDGNMAVWEEVQGKVAAKTPVIIATVGAKASDNRLNLDHADAAKPAGNLLQGLFFENSYFYPYPSEYFHATTYDPATMRLLGVTKDGKLGFVKSDAKYVPRNRAFIFVPAGSPDEITLVTKAEYDELKTKDAVTVTARSYSREYGEANPTFEYDVTDGTLNGQPELTCEATPQSPVGDYTIVVGKGTVTNEEFTGVNGTLTVTKAPLTITAKSYTIKQNETLPVYEAEYAGFKNGETADVLTVKPELSCILPETSPYPIGEYEITVSGAEAGNYDITYIPGKLTIVEADPITLTVADATMVYGDKVPEFTYKVTGGEVEGQPVISCEATSKSSVGKYSINIEKGTVDYPNLKLVAGTLTITKAPLTVSVGEYSREEGQPNPEFVLSYEGFRNGDTPETAFSVFPTATTTANVESEAGDYEIVVSGGEAKNYELTYVNGKLTVKMQDGIHNVVLKSPVNVYTLTGRLIRSNTTSLKGLKKGVYFVGNRKVIIR